MFTTKEYFFILLFSHHPKPLMKTLIWKYLWKLFCTNCFEYKFWKHMGNLWESGFLTLKFFKTAEIWTWEHLHSHLQKSRWLGLNGLFEGQQKRRYATVTQSFNKNVRISLHEIVNKKLVTPSAHFSVAFKVSEGLITWGASPSHGYSLCCGFLHVLCVHLRASVLFRHCHCRTAPSLT